MASHKSSTHSTIYFWKPEQDDGYLGNWYPSPFTVGSLTFHNSEHYFMWKKVMLFEPEMEAKILATSNPKTMKAIGQAVKNYDDTVWNNERYKIMVEALMHKFSQNVDLKKRLMETGTSELVEASPLDRIWGIGITKADALIGKKRNGQNLLGKALMEVRDKMK
jgi:hypothetical protein